MLFRSSGSITEGSSIANTQSIAANFASTLAENFTLLDSSTQTSAFLQSLTENFNVNTNLKTYGWIAINNTQLINWTPVNDDQ